MTQALEAINRLKEGNRRFVSCIEKGEALRTRTRPMELTQVQNPIAVILGCSDARVPSEIVFDQGLGDLFVIRVIGNIVAPSQVGSVEFAASQLGTRLVVVLGHTQCGAIQAAIDELVRSAEHRSPNLRSVVDRVRPSVEPLLHTELRNDIPSLARHAMRANVSASAAHLRSGSPILEELIHTSGLMVVGAQYAVETGVVEFFDGI